MQLNHIFISFHCANAAANYCDMTAKIKLLGCTYQQIHAGLFYACCTDTPAEIAAKLEPLRQAGDTIAVIRSETFIVNPSDKLPIDTINTIITMD